MPGEYRPPHRKRLPKKPQDPDPSQDDILAEAWGGPDPMGSWDFARRALQEHQLGDLVWEKVLPSHAEPIAGPGQPISRGQAPYTPCHHQFPLLVTSKKEKQAKYIITPCTRWSCPYGVTNQICQEFAEFEKMWAEAGTPALFRKSVLVGTHWENVHQKIKATPNAFAVAIPGPKVQRKEGGKYRSKKQLIVFTGVELTGSDRLPLGDRLEVLLTYARRPGPPKVRKGREWVAGQRQPIHRIRSVAGPGFGSGGKKQSGWEQRQDVDYPRFDELTRQLGGSSRSGFLWRRTRNIDAWQGGDHFQKFLDSLDPPPLP